MKKLATSFIFISIFFLTQTFASSNPEYLELLKISVNLDNMENIYEKDIYGELLPIYLVSNGIVTPEEGLKYKSYPVKIVNDDSSLPKSNDFQSLKLHSLKLKKKKSLIHLSHKDKDIKIRLKKVSGEWVYASMVTKTRTSLEVDF